MDPHSWSTLRIVSLVRVPPCVDTLPAKALPCRGLVPRVARAGREVRMRNPFRGLPALTGCAGPYPQAISPGSARKASVSRAPQNPSARPAGQK